MTDNAVTGTWRPRHQDPHEDPHQDPAPAPLDRRQPMRLVNLTPHPLRLRRGYTEVVIQPSGLPAPRVEEEADRLGHFAADDRYLVAPEQEAETTTSYVIGDIAYDSALVPVAVVRLGKVHDLPEPEEGTYLVVSRMVAEAVPHRRDLLIPYQQIRDDSGRIVGAGALGQVPDPAEVPT